MTDTTMLPTDQQGPLPWTMTEFTVERNGRCPRCGKMLRVGATAISNDVDGNSLCSRRCALAIVDIAAASHESFPRHMAGRLASFIVDATPRSTSLALAIEEQQRLLQQAQDARDFHAVLSQMLGGR